jgi:hypothetical protein
MTNLIQNKTPIRATFFLKIPFNQVTEDIRSDAFRYCHRQGLSPSGFFKIKEGIIGFPEEDYTHNILCDIANKCQKDGSIVVFTNFNLPLNSFTIINQAMETGKLTVRPWKL